MNIEETIKRILGGDNRSAARLMRDIDNDKPQAIELIKILHQYAGQAWVLGITGAPGVGKSTLVDALITAFRAQDKRVGVVAVDPSSPLSGGAILGDRIRMQRHAADEEVFIHSLATRGYFGGITASTWGVVTIMDAMGKEEILVETVGVGQDEIDIAYMADTTVIVLVPGLGDDIQAIKAGILEIGDIFVVNKMDRKDANRSAIELENMLTLREQARVKPNWRPPVVMTCSYDGRGINELREVIASHRRLLMSNGQALFIERRQARAQLQLLALIKNRLILYLQKMLKTKDQGLERLVKDIVLHRRDPYSVCDEIITNFISF